MTDSLSAFTARHIGPRDHDVADMLSTIGLSSLDELASAAVPDAIRSADALDIEAAPSEHVVVKELRGIADRNKVLTSMIGLGYYGTIVPPVIARNVLENPAWYTAYTPYQPEISQGRLEALLNFQTVVTDLTGLDLAGSSLLDEATAAAEAMTLMRRVSKAPAGAVLLVDEAVFPQTLGVIRTRPSGCPWSLRTSGGSTMSTPCGPPLATRTSSVSSSSTPTAQAVCVTIEPSLRRPMSTAHWSRQPLTCSRSLWPPRRESGARTSPSAPPRGSGCRWASVARTPAT